MWRRGQRTYPADGGAFWRLRWWSGLEGERYAPSTVARKRRDRLPTDRVVLFQTGEMYKRTTLLPQPDGWLVRVEVQYAKYLRSRYGEKIFALTGESASDFRREILIQAIKHYRLWRRKR